jgi:hypothetical protein
MHNWPTAEAINRRIELSESVNNDRISRLHGRGESFLRYGEKYGINPGFAVAIAQKECQCGADGSLLPRYNNFGGITDPRGSRSTCVPITYNGRQWANYCKVEEGIEGIFKVLDQTIYRQSGGSVESVVDIYSPPHENSRAEMLKIIAIVGVQLEINLTRAVPIYIPQRVTSRVTQRFKKKVY